jgi:DNA invertase Pin-like site-specific DNA recombinase
MKSETKYVSYLRVSTNRQGIDGLGIEAQRQSVRMVFGEPIKECVEVESGRNNKRPELLKAIEVCKKEGATLVIAKLDRLSRNPMFVFTLRDSGVKFVTADNPHANELTINLLAVIAGDEVARTRDRVKKALAVKKQQLALEGKKLGCPAITKTGRTIKEVMLENRKARVYYKPDPSKVHTLKVLKEAGEPISKLQEVAKDLFGKSLSSVTIYKYLQL